MRKLLECAQIALKVDYLAWVKRISIQLFFTAFLALGLDYFLGDRLLEFAAPAALDYVKVQRGGFEWRKPHPVFHHTLESNADVLDSWGGETYRLCTNALGAKSSCTSRESAGSHYDMVFIGDSFTEGVGLPYEKTFVGRIAAAMPEKKILNLGVVSYAPSIYYKKIEYLLNAGLELGEVIVFVDISDIQDETQYYLRDGVVDSLAKKRSADIFESVSWRFPILRYSYFTLKTKKERRKYGLDPERSAWTYRKNLKSYGKLGVEGGIEKALAMMASLHALLAEKNIPLSVAVYPWPDQIIHDTEESRQVQIWREFCREKCAQFYNFFPAFFEKSRVLGKQEAIRRYFWPGDIHHNPEGAQLIADGFLSQRQKWQKWQSSLTRN